MTNETVLFDISTWSNKVATVILPLNSCFGLYFNIYIIHSFITNRHQKTSFNMICFFRALNNLLILIAMTLVYMPAIILGYSIYPEIVESIILVSCINLMIFNEFQGIYLAVNRFFAIFFPIKYQVVFSLKLTFALHIVYYLDRVRNVTMEHIDRYRQNAYLLFSTEHLAYGGINQPPDGMVKWAIGLMAFPFVVNGFTFVKYFHLKNHQTSRDTERWEQAKKNMVQFLQTFFQDSLFSISVICTLKLNTVISHRLWTFFAQTFMWQIIHVLDGLIMKFFHDRLREKHQPQQVTPAETTGKPRETAQR